MTKQEVRTRIEELAIVPAVRAANAEDALFAAEAVSRGGLAIVELTMTVPNATELIAHLVAKHPHMLVGAGTVLTIETARACLDERAGLDELRGDLVDRRRRWHANGNVDRYLSLCGLANGKATANEERKQDRARQDAAARLVRPGHDGDLGLQDVGNLRRRPEGKGVFTR